MSERMQAVIDAYRVYMKARGASMKHPPVGTVVKRRDAYEALFERLEELAEPEP